MIGSAIAMLIGRYLLSGWAQSQARKYKIFDAFELEMDTEVSFSFIFIGSKTHIFDEAMTFITIQYFQLHDGHHSNEHLELFIRRAWDASRNHGLCIPWYCHARHL